VTAADPGPACHEPGCAYHEPGCGYRGLAWCGALLVVGFLIDLGIGGARAHVVAWLVAAVVLLGADLVIIRATRLFKTLDVTGEEVRIGEEAVARADVVTASATVDDEAPVLGWSSGMPRRRGAVCLDLRDGRRVVVPTRRPDAVLAALGAAQPVGGQSADGQPAGGLDVRPATAQELPLLAEIDERADTLFRVAGYDLPAIEPSDDAAAAVFVAGRPPVGFARVDEVDGLAHLTEVAVVPGSMRRGVGSALLAAACDWARAAGHPAITLTTYADVPWNAPMYARRGWVEIEAQTPGLRAIRAREAALGLDAVGRRVVMRREL